MGSFRSRLSEVTGLTLASRILGLARDVLMFAVLGNGALTAAFLLAFTLPNLFRRLLGEGALASSSIPVLTEVAHLQGREPAFALLNALIGRLLVLLLVLLLMGSGLLFLVRYQPGLAERWYGGAELAMVLMPYMVLVCLSAFLCGMLQVLGRFALAAANQIWLNLTMIGAMLAGLYAGPGWAQGTIWLLCGGVLAGGLLQVVVPVWGLAREGWRAGSWWERNLHLHKVLRLFVPGILGAALFQINILVTRLLAFSLNDAATGLLYIANRLVELPLGLFGIAIATVVFPEMSAHQARGERGSFKESFAKGLRLTLAITIPAALGLGLLAEPVLGLLFKWGMFGMEDVREAVPVLQTAVLGLQFFAASTLLTRAWYAIQQLRVPVFLSLMLVLANLVLGVIFMRIWGTLGLALSNVVSSALHCLLLFVLFPLPLGGFGRWRDSVAVLAGLLAVTTICLAARSLGTPFMASGKTGELILVAVTVPLAAALYFGILRLFKHQSFTDLGRDQ